MDAVLRSYGQHVKPTGTTGESGAPARKKPKKVVWLTDRPLGKPTPTAAPAAAAPPPGQTAGAALPPDPAYEQQIAGLTKGRDDTLAGLRNQQTAGLADYGYTAQNDAGGNAVGVSFDPNNPFSQAALLRKHLGQAQTGNSNRYAAAGQLYAGSLQNAQDTSQDQFNRSDDSLQRMALAFVLGNQGQANAARNQWEIDTGGASGERVGRLPTNPLYSAFTAAQQGGATSAPSDTGGMKVTAAGGPAALTKQTKNTTVKLASGWSIEYDAAGRPVRFIPPGG